MFKYLRLGCLTFSCFLCLKQAPLTVEAKESLSEQIDQAVKAVLKSYDYQRDEIALAFYYFPEDLTYEIQADKVYFAASTTKVGIAILFYDLIDQGIVSHETIVAYQDNFHEEGGGTITSAPKAAYTIDELISQALVYSDNTALNLLVNYYFALGMDPYNQLLVRSGIEVNDHQLYEMNYANARMLNQLLIELATTETYNGIVDLMVQSQTGQYLKTDLKEDEVMASKYGRYDDYIHDSGIVYQDGQALYSLVVLTEDLKLDERGITDEFFGQLNRKILDTVYQYQKNS